MVKSGDKLEKKVKFILEDTFVAVEGPPVKTRFQRRDFFGLFDFICLNTHGMLVGVQVSRKYLSSKDKDFKASWEKWKGIKIYIREDNKGQLHFNEVKFEN